MWGKIANVIKYSKLTRVRNDTLDLMSALGKIMEKLIRALNNRDSKEENVLASTVFLKNTYAANLILNEIINVLIMVVV